MDTQLFFRAVGKFFSGLIAVVLLIFLPAGTFDYWRAWLLTGILFVPMFVAGLIMLVKCPQLLEKRLNVREQETEQKQVIAMSGLMFVGIFITAGLGVRLQWHILPDWVSWTAAGIFLLGYLLYAEVLRENVYLSRTVEVQDGQQVIDTGLYGLVRHPMYAATLLLFLSMPLILGSTISFVIALCYLPIIAKRIRNEEAVLAAALAGYAEYQKKVRYKLIPFVW